MPAAMNSHHVENTYSTKETPGPQPNGLWSRVRRWKSSPSRHSTEIDKSRLTEDDRDFRRTTPRPAPPARGGRETVSLLTAHGDARNIAGLRIARELAEASNIPIATRIAEMDEEHKKQLKCIQDDLNNALSHWEDVHRRESHDATNASGPITCSRCRQHQLDAAASPKTNDNTGHEEQINRFKLEGWDVTEQKVLEVLTSQNLDWEVVRTPTSSNENSIPPSSEPSLGLGLRHPNPLSIHPYVLGSQPPSRDLAFYSANTRSESGPFRANFRPLIAEYNQELQDTRATRCFVALSNKTQPSAKRVICPMLPRIQSTNKDNDNARSNSEFEDLQELAHSSGNRPASSSSDGSVVDFSEVLDP